MKPALVCTLLVLAACSSSVDAPMEDAGVDAPSSDMAQTDTGTDAYVVDANPNEPDAEPDAPALDAFADSPSDMSATQDAGETVDGGGVDAGGCAYIDIAPFVVSCPEIGFTEGTHWINSAGSSPECPDFYTLNDSRGATEGEAISAASCSPSCVYHATRSVDLRYCGRRIGYERYDATRPRTCPSIIAIGSGYYSDFSEYSTSHPCPDAGADVDAGAVADAG